MTLPIGAIVVIVTIVTSLRWPAKFRELPGSLTASQPYYTSLTGPLGIERSRLRYRCITGGKGPGCDAELLRLVRIAGGAR